MTYTTKKAYCAAITEVPEYIQLMAEPVRAVSALSMTLVTRVIGRSSVKMITLGFTPDDVVCGAQLECISDHINDPMIVFSEGCGSIIAVFAGQTCDSVDRFGDQENLPELSLGDVIVPEIRAYGIATDNHFNGIALPSIIDLENIPETQRSLA